METTLNAAPVRTTEQLDYLDGWRGIAISLLIVGHFFPYWRFDLGTAGVNFFFVLSGFLMAKQLFLRQTPIPVFYKRRISRIFPALYVFILTTIVSYSIAGLPVSWDTAIGAIGLLRNYYPEGFGNKLPFDHIWSLSVEEHSYILLSIVAVFLRGKIERQQLALGVLSCGFVLVAAWYLSKFAGPGIYGKKLIHTEVAAFGIFFSAFLLLFFRHGIKGNIPGAVFCVLPIIALGAHYFSAPYLLTLLAGVGSLALMVNVLHKAPAWMLRALSLPLLRKLGLWSYSIYLWQQPFYVLKNNGVLSAPAACFFALLVGVISYFLVESPIRNYLNRTWAKKTESGLRMSRA